MVKLRTKSGNSLPKAALLNSKLVNRWYVVSNRVEAVIYQHEPKSIFKFFKRLSNPEGKLMEAELDSDRAGQAGAGGSVRHSLDKTNVRHERLAQSFANKISAFLKTSVPKNSVKEIVLVSEPHFMGLLQKSLPASIKTLVKYKINKEYARGSDEELYEAIQKAIKKK